MRIYSRPINSAGDARIATSNALDIEPDVTPASTTEGPQSALLLEVVNAMTRLLKAHAAQADASGVLPPPSEPQ